MAFYLKPPRGDIQMEKLLELASNRAEFLTILSDFDEESVEEFHDKLQSYGHLSDSVADGFCNDRIAHFTLKLAVISASDSGLKSALIELESKLFNYRMKTHSADILYARLRETRRHLKGLQPSHELHQILAESIDQILLHRLLDLNAEAAIKVPFQVVPNFVRNRRVSVEEGEAIVPAVLIPEYLKNLFRLCLNLTLNNRGTLTDYGRCEDDQRVANLLKKVVQVFHAFVLTEQASKHLDFPVLKWDEIGNVSHYFPPCFKSIQLKLSENHRLGHHARVAYTLFLKEIGLPLNEALKFWQHHYSKPGSSTCSHSWQKDAKRYSYSIRSLYGFNSSKIDYSGHGCVSIINKCSPTSELTCPFASKDIEDFVGAGLSEQRAKEILKSPNGHDVCLQACSRLLDQVTQSEPVPLVKKPSEFYSYSNNIISTNKQN